MNKHQMKQHYVFWLLTIWLGVFAMPAYAATVEKVDDLGFGKLVAGSGGTVVINPNGGARSVTGGVIAIGSSGFQPAKFKVTFTVLEVLLGPLVPLTYTVSPDPTTINGNNGGSMNVTSYVGYPNPLGQNLLGNILGLLTNRSYDFFVGGTLTVSPNQTSGSYTNDITVTVSF